LTLSAILSGIINQLVDIVNYIFKVFCSPGWR